MDSDQGISISITTDAELAAVQRARAEYARMAAQFKQAGKDVTELNKLLGDCDDALESNASKILQRRQELEKMIQLGAKAGADVTDQIDEYDKLAQSEEGVAIGLDKMANGAQVAGTAMQVADTKGKAFGIGVNKLIKSMKGFAHMIPGLNIALRFLGGSMMATMGAIMAVGMAVQKVQEHFKKLEEEYKKFSEEAAKPMRDNAKAQEKALDEQRAAMDRVDAKLIETIGHHKTMAEAMKEEEDGIKRAAKAREELASVAREAETFELEALKEKKLVSVEDFERRKAEIEARARKDKFEREQALERELLAAREKVAEEWEREGRGKARAEWKAKGESAAAAQARVEGMVTPEARKAEVARIDALRQKAIKRHEAAQKDIKAAESGGWAGANIPAVRAIAAKAKEDLDLLQFQYDQAVGMEQGYGEERRDRMSEARLAESEFKAAEGTYLGGEATAAKVRQDAALKRAELSAEAGAFGATEAARAKLQARKFNFQDWMRRRSGQGVQSGERRMRFRWVEEAVALGKMSRDQGDRLLRGLRDSPEEKDTLLAALKTDYDSGLVGADDYQRARLQLLTQAPPDYRTIYYGWDRVFRETARTGRVPEGWGFAEGGYTGDGPPGQVAGAVHKGEFVIPAAVVNTMPQLKGLRRGAMSAATNPRNPFNVSVTSPPSQWPPLSSTMPAPADAFFGPTLPMDARRSRPGRPVYHSAQYANMVFAAEQERARYRRQLAARDMAGVGSDLFPATHALGAFHADGAPMSREADHADTMARIHRRNLAPNAVRTVFAKAAPVAAPHGAGGATLFQVADSMSHMAGLMRQVAQEMASIEAQMRNAARPM